MSGSHVASVILKMYLPSWLKGRRLFMVMNRWGIATFSIMGCFVQRRYECLVIRVCLV